jgi:hypothetical protein
VDYENYRQGYADGKTDALQGKPKNPRPVETVSPGYTLGYLDGYAYGEILAAGA